MSLGIHYNREGADLFTYLRDPAPFEVSQGTIATLEAPGLGIEIDEARVRDEASRPFAWRNPAWRGPDGELREW
jgi:galactonate dehydratase